MKSQFESACLVFTSPRSQWGPPSGYLHLHWFEGNSFALPLSWRLPTQNQILAQPSFLGYSENPLIHPVVNGTAVMLRSLWAPLLHVWIYRVHQAAGSRASAEDAGIQWGFQNTYSRDHCVSRFKFAFLCRKIPLEFSFWITPLQEKPFHRLLFQLE